MKHCPIYVQNLQSADILVNAFNYSLDSSHPPCKHAQDVKEEVLKIHDAEGGQRAYTEWVIPFAINMSRIDGSSTLTCLDCIKEELLKKQEQ